MSQLIRTLKGHIRDEIIKKGGWVNAHAHADRAFTMTPEKITVYQNANLQQKWDLVDEVKRNSSVEDYYRRFSQAIELMISQGVTAFGTFVDIDQVCEDRAIIAAHKAREVYKNDIILKFANQTLKGVIEPNAKKWFDIGSEMVDMIGGLPYRDELDYGKGLEAMDILMDKAKSLGKMLHVHVDQFNSPKEKRPNNCVINRLSMVCKGEWLPFTGFPSARTRKNIEKCFTKKCVIAK